MLVTYKLLSLNLYYLYIYYTCIYVPKTDDLTGMQGSASKEGRKADRTDDQQNPPTEPTHFSTKEQQAPKAAK